MLDRIGRSRPAPDTDMVMRATAVPALATLAVIHVLDLPAPWTRSRSSGSAISRSSPPRSWLVGR
jgi:hypothetical protein